MTLKEIGEEFKANSETVRLWVTRGDLRAVRTGRKWIVRRSEVLRFIGSRTDPEQEYQLHDSRAVQDRLDESGRPPVSGSRLTDARGVVERVGG
jgi:excisionase family DNA binding protein